MRRKFFFGLLFMACLLPVGLGCPRLPGREPTISVFYHENGRKRRVPIEEYLVGVVAGEMKPDWPEEAYAAQAILARTFTMEFIERGGTRRLHGTDICTDQKHAQAYTESAITPVIRRAVARTKGLVMRYRGRYVRGWFSASCGGRTTFARVGLALKEPEPPYISSVTCPETAVIPKEELFWTASFTPAELAAAVKKSTGREIGPVQELTAIAKDEPTGRTIRFRLQGSTGTVEVAAADLRVALGPEKMRSIWLTELRTTPGQVTMAGRGFGHGVGLCQWGAYTLAKRGKSPEEIVRHYYPKVRIVKEW
ncbi:MAG: SpoIID/LytB domain-containing protein [Firmicutes bacterium]|nr:SpoIID/LytB domain-containing protein [Bacillota bacterium]